MISRDIAPDLLAASSEYPVVTILGPRQSGKTTLARMCFPSKPYVSLEAPDIRAAVKADPRSFLAGHRDGAILGEFQRVPDLLPCIKDKVDSDGRRGLYILTGSYRRLLDIPISRSLAGRTAVITL